MFGWGGGLEDRCQDKSYETHAQEAGGVREFKVWGIQGKEI